jgi:formylglycine-generating enzyme required for sulfatase activity
VTYVNWQQAKAFAEFAGARLPTEAEWEYAAKSGGQDIVYPWGNEEPNCDRLNFNQCVGDTTPVCTYATGNTAQGLCDMAGNVWEWVEDDWHDSYEGAPVDGSAYIDNPRGSGRVFRGGSWLHVAGTVRAAYRDGGDPSRANDFRGFRLARSAP